MQDNIRAHTAQICKDLLDQQHFNVLLWPALSPDLNPIKHVGDLWGRAVASMNIANVQQLADALVDAWNKIHRGKISHIIYSMNRRCRSVVDAEGGHKRY